MSPLDKVVRRAQEFRVEEPYRSTGLSQAFNGRLQRQIVLLSRVPNGSEESIPTRYFLWLMLAVLLHLTTSN